MPPSNALPARCASHNLAVGPDGQCIVCRRERAAVPRHPGLPQRGAPIFHDVPSKAPFVEDAHANERSSGASRVLFVLSVLAAVGGIAWFTLHGAGFALTTDDDTVMAVQPTAPVEVAQNAQPVAGSGSKPLNLDDEPIAGRDAQPVVQGELTGPAALQRKPGSSVDEQTLGASKEEQERDRLRHTQVTAQLDHTASLRHDVKITMYSTSWCGACKAARKYMTEKQIPFTDYDVEKNAEANAQADVLNPKGTVPTITIDHEMMIGFSGAGLEERITRAAERRAHL